ncbi:hypothetical protein L6R49_00245 [Myxococcota bacterium]|nr:hypothetical protein [Myxococcota bacterium]
MNSETPTPRAKGDIGPEPETDDTLTLDDVGEGLGEHHAAAGAISAGIVGQAVGAAALNATAFLQSAQTLSVAALAQALAKGEGAARTEEEIFAALSKATAHFEQVITFALQTADRVARRSG